MVGAVGIGRHGRENMGNSVLSLEGSNYEIGFELGKWWVKRITQLKFRGFESWLESRQFETKYFPLMNYAYKNFPDLMAQIEGMADGISKRGWKTSIGNVFLYSIGENWGCSSFVVKQKDSVLMGHNEEDNKKYPLCVANVTLKCKAQKEPIEFVSASYPFQLFGSVGGMNRYLAFQGNSIGIKGKARRLESTWNHRAPKAFLTRKMLECTSIGEIEELFGKHHSTLPSHHFIATYNKAYSLEIRPIMDIGENHEGSAKDQLRIKTVEGFSTHTNHFIENGKPDLDWSWEVKGNYMGDSKKHP